jgi:hypothetical protein
VSNPCTNEKSENQTLITRCRGGYLGVSLNESSVNLENELIDLFILKLTFIF